MITLFLACDRPWPVDALTKVITLRVLLQLFNSVCNSKAGY